MILSNADAVAQAASGQRLLIDIRQSQEWLSTGTPFHAILLAGNDPTFFSQLETLTQHNKNTSLAIMCAAGKRSAAMQQHLISLGYTDVADVSGGIMGHIAAGLPVRPYAFPAGDGIS